MVDSGLDAGVTETVKTEALPEMVDVTCRDVTCWVVDALELTVVLGPAAVEDVRPPVLGPPPLGREKSSAPVSQHDCPPESSGRFPSQQYRPGEHSLMASLPIAVLSIWHGEGESGSE